MLLRVSQELKGREWFRPLAPILLRTRAPQLFEDFREDPPARFMLCEYRVKPTATQALAAVTHVDGTARAQLVDDHDPNLEHMVQILTAIGDDYGVPALINTSFNMRGEPIVQTPEDAQRSAYCMGLDGLLIGSNSIRLRGVSCHG
jgi:carbamoyltransferase